MYSKLHKAIKDKCGRFINAGSCVFLVDYLKKEETEKNTFFSHDRDSVLSSEVVNAIDQNKKTLKSKQEKFYMLTYNPSEKEIKHLIKKTLRKEAENWYDLTPIERQKVMDEFKVYVRNNMEIYASNFNREKPINGKDLVYFAKIEENRYEDEKEEYGCLGNSKHAKKKDGFNLHCHVIVSRMDKTQTIALSPRSKNREVTTQLNGKVVKGGFNLMKWKKECEDAFALKYNYIYTKGERYEDNPLYIAKMKLNKRIRQKIMDELMEDLKEERKVIRGASMMRGLLVNPKKTLKSFLKREIKNILLDNQQTEI